MSSNRNPLIDGPEHTQFPPREHRGAEIEHANVPDLFSVALRSTRLQQAEPGAASRSEARCSSAPCAAPVEQTIRKHETRWGSCWEAIARGFMLYGVSVYPIDFMPLDLFAPLERDDTGQRRPAAEAIVADARRVHAANSPPVSPRAAVESDEQGSGRQGVLRPGLLRKLSAIAAMPWAWLRREPDIRRPLERLDRLDDHMLRDIGVCDRCQIEALVRRLRD